MLESKRLLELIVVAGGADQTWGFPPLGGGDRPAFAHRVGQVRSRRIVAIFGRDCPRDIVTDNRHVRFFMFVTNRPWTPGNDRVGSRRIGVESFAKKSPASSKGIEPRASGRRTGAMSERVEVSLQGGRFVAVESTPNHRRSATKRKRSFLA